MAGFLVRVCCWLGLWDGIYLRRASGNDKQSLKALVIVTSGFTG
jgi:hypothetical protein